MPEIFLIRFSQSSAVLSREYFFATSIDDYHHISGTFKIVRAAFNKAVLFPSSTVRPFCQFSMLSETPGTLYATVEVPADAASIMEIPHPSVTEEWMFNHEEATIFDSSKSDILHVNSTLLFMPKSSTLSKFS